MLANSHRKVARRMTVSEFVSQGPQIERIDHYDNGYY